MTKRTDKEWPAAKFHFKVSIAGDEYSFQEVSGLGAEYTTIDYKVGNKTLNSMKLSGQSKNPNLVLKKGIFKNDDELAKLFDLDVKKYYFEDKKIDIVIELMNQKETIMKWNIKRAFPVKFTGTDLKSTENAIAVESIEFVYEEIETKKV